MGWTGRAPAPQLSGELVKRPPETPLADLTERPRVVTRARRCDCSRRCCPTRRACSALITRTRSRRAAGFRLLTCSENLLPV